MHITSRLIDQFVPEHYDLSLTLKRQERTFHGIVTMNGSSVDGATEIVVHCKELVIESTLIDGKTATFKTGKDDELHMSQPRLAPGKHIVVITFSGSITDAMHGLYPCYYEHDGIKKELLATQFESHHAREAFPCIDEPAAKASYKVTLSTEQNVAVIGNMPVASQRVEDDVLVTSFETTPRMSSYLLAWVVGELHKQSGKTTSGVDVNVWATPAQTSASLTFALDIAIRSIEFYDEYFGTAYPLPKSDHVALPDFTSGAMENWGLITYREIALLVDPDTTSVSMRHYVATVIAHELAHQWFGNLVTMKWWNDLWLNESFANLMEYVAIDALEPSWDIWLDFSTSESIMALRRDSIDGVQSVQSTVNHPDEISTLFDPAIVYAKGARLMRMLQAYIGNESFQAGLKQYFKRHAYKNTDANDLWRAMSDASGQDIAAFMMIWIEHPGYPVLHVSSDANNAITISQERFFIGNHASDDTIWPIPLDSTSSKMPKLLDEKMITTPRSHTATIRFNVGDTAHFITQYSPELLALITKDLAENKLTPLDRVQLLHEQTLLARASLISSAELIPLLKAYSGEVAEAVWDIMGIATSDLIKFIETDEPARTKLRELSANLSRHLYQQLGWDIRPNEPETETKLRAIIINNMVFARDKEALNHALELYHSTPVEKLDPELRSTILGAAVRFDPDQSIVDSLVEVYKKSSSPELQNDIVSAIALTQDPDTIKKLIGFIQDSSVVRPQDVARWYVRLLSNIHARSFVWQWLRDNWAWIEKTFGGDMSYDDYPMYTARILSSRSQLDEYRAFFGPMKSIVALERVITVGESEIEGRVELIERDRDKVRRALLEL